MVPVNHPHWQPENTFMMPVNYPHWESEHTSLVPVKVNECVCCKNSKITISILIHANNSFILSLETLDQTDFHIEQILKNEHLYLATCITCTIFWNNQSEELLINCFKNKSRPRSQEIDNTDNYHDKHRSMSWAFFKHNRVAPNLVTGCCGRL